MTTYTKGIGQLTIDRYQAEAHFNGSSNRHKASNIDLTNPLVIDGYTINTVQDAVLNVTNIINSGNVGFYATGDLSGTASAQTVIGLQGRPISATLPTVGYVLSWNGSSWTPTAFSSLGGFVAGTDLSGTTTAQTVIGLRGRSVSNNTPSDGYVLTWVAGNNDWEPKPILSSSVNMGGDISGNSASATVAKINGITLTGTPSVGQVLTALSSSTANWQNPATFTASGDLSGTSSSQSVIRIQGKTVSSTAPLDAQAFIWNNSLTRWEPRALNLAASNAVTGQLPSANQAAQTLSGDVIGTTAASTVVKLNGYKVIPTAPTDGYVLTWVNADGYWEPKPATVTSTNVAGDLTGTTAAASVISIAGLAGILSVNAPNFYWSNTAGSITLKQLDIANHDGYTARILAQNAITNGYNGANLLIQSGNGGGNPLGGGANGNGGNVIIQSGYGGSNAKDGYIYLDGYSVIKGDGYNATAVFDSQKFGLINTGLRHNIKPISFTSGIAGYAYTVLNNDDVVVITSVVSISLGGATNVDIFFPVSPNIGDTFTIKDASGYTPGGGGGSLRLNGSSNYIDGVAAASQPISISFPTSYAYRTYTFVSVAVGWVRIA